MSKTLSEFNVAELRLSLCEEFGWTDAEAKNVKGKKALIAAIDKEIETIGQDIEESRQEVEQEFDTLEDETSDMHDNINEDILNELDTLEETSESDYIAKIGEATLEPREEIENGKGEITYGPTPSDPEWTDYVLGQLTEDEIIKDKNNPKKGYPTTDGLRRMVEKLVGPIIKSNTTIHQVPNPENERRATVVVNIGIFNDLYSVALEFSGAADVYVGNSCVPFGNHPVATAETKAEGRAYKRALKIKVSTYEEMNGASSDDIVFPTNTTLMNDSIYIKSDQLNFIDILCQRLDINPTKFIHNFLPNFSKVPKLLPYDESCNILALLQKYQGKGKEVAVIEEQIKGYNANWQNESLNNVTSTAGEKNESAV